MAVIELSARLTNPFDRNGYHLIIDDIPALVCEQRQEPLFTE